MKFNWLGKLSVHSPKANLAQARKDRTEDFGATSESLPAEIESKLKGVLRKKWSRKFGEKEKA